MTSGSQDSVRPVCACGYDRSHYMVSAQPSYTLWGSLCVTVFGITTEPVSIAFFCRRCQTHFEQTTDPEDLRRYT